MTRHSLPNRAIHALVVAMLLTLGLAVSTAEPDEVWWKWTRIATYKKSTKEWTTGDWARHDAYDTARECRWSYPNNGKPMRAFQPQGSDYKFAFFGDEAYVDGPEFFIKTTYKCLPGSQEP